VNPVNYPIRLSGSGWCASSVVGGVSAVLGGVSVLATYIYIEISVLSNLLLTKGPLLRSRANDRFAPLCSLSALPCSLTAPSLLPRCSLVLPYASSQPPACCLGAYSRHPALQLYLILWCRGFPICLAFLAFFTKAIYLV